MTPTDATTVRPSRPSPLPFLALGALATASSVMVMRHWGEQRVFHGSALDMLSSVGLLLMLLTAIYRASTSPLRLPIIALLVADTLRDAWIFGPWGSGSAALIGPINLAIELGYLAAAALLYFDRPESEVVATGRPQGV